jgi:hypothetical protein
MADTKISALPASTTPLAGTEVLPIVQGGATKQVSVANLTTGRAISATELTLTTGNLIVSTGKGIDFSATPGTGTSELLSDYEEGTWTPVIRGSGSAGTESGSKDATYTKIGNRVMARLSLIAYTLTGATGNITLTGLPFTARWNGLVVYAEGFTPAFTAAIESGGALTLSSTTSSGATEAGFRPSVSATWDNYMTSSTVWTGGGGSTYMHIELLGTV